MTRWLSIFCTRSRQTLMTISRPVPPRNDATVQSTPSADLHERRNHRDQGQERRADVGDPQHDLLEVVGRPPARAGSPG